jgi:phosphoglycolate phosphatase
MFKALICDLDMTILESKRDIAIAAAHAASTLGFHDFSESEVAPWIGKGLAHMLQSLIPEATEAQIEQCTKAYRLYFQDHCAVHTFIYPGVVKTLEAVRKAGMKTAIASAKLTFMARHVCKVHGVDRLFDHIQGTDDFPGKPDPTALYYACDAIGVPPTESMMVGDTLMDVQAGKNAGCAAVAVSYGIGDVEALKAEIPDRIIDRFDQLLPLLGL